MLSCGKFSGAKGVSPRPELLTTSGIRVRDANGNYFVTVASQGFPTDREKVYHPSSDNSAIGQVVRRLGDSDIALVKLEDGVNFVNETFDVEGVASSPLHRLSDRKILSAEILHMNNPFTSHVEGVFLYEGRHCIPSDEAEHAHVWAKCWLFWLGTDCPDYADGSCGSPI